MFTLFHTLRLGDPMMLHYIIKSKPLDMTSLESLPIEELCAICRECKINNVARLSKVFSAIFC